MSGYRPGAMDYLIDALERDCKRRGLTDTETMAEMSAVLTKAAQDAERSYRESPLPKIVRGLAIAAAASRVRMWEGLLDEESTP